MADSLEKDKPAAPVKDTGDGLLDLETRKKYFQESQDFTQNARKLSEQDRDYRDHKQWTAYELQKLRKRGQPPIVINRIARKVDTMLGIAERGVTDPKGYPRSPDDEDAAEVCTDTLRYVCDQNRYQRIKQASLENMIVEGMAGCEVIVEKRNDQIEVMINRVRWEEIFYDPFSRENDFSDARFKGSAKWMDVQVVGRLFGDKAKATAESSMGGVGMVSGSMEDRPKTMVGMIDRKMKRLVVVDMYCKGDNGWDRYVFCAGGDLVEPGPSPYLDEFKVPTCPIELQSLYTNRENERYGLVRGMLGPQDEINYRRSKLLHLTSTRQTFSNGKAEVDVDKLKTEMSRPDGHMDMKGFAEWGKDFGIVPTGDMAKGQAELLAEAKSEIELFGANNALQGRGNDNQSGKAWELRQQSGMTEISILFAAAADLDLRVYRQIWMRVQQYWTEQRFVRVTDNEQAFKFLTVNEPVMVPVIDPMTGHPQIDPQTGKPAMHPQIDPRTGQPMVKNRPEEMDMDIIIETSPDFINAAQEQFEMLVKLKSEGAPIPIEAIIASSNIRDKRQILDAIKQAQANQGPPPPDPVEVEKAKQSGLVAESTARKNNADAEAVELLNAATVGIPLPGMMMPQQQLPIPAHQLAQAPQPPQQGAMQAQPMPQPPQGGPPMPQPPQGGPPMPHVNMPPQLKPAVDPTMPRVNPLPGIIKDQAMRGTVGRQLN